MATFSDRMGITSAPQEIQISSLNDALRISLWNWIYEVLRFDSNTAGVKQFFLIVWCDYCKYPVNKAPHYSRDRLAFLEEKFFTDKWYEAYNLIEFIFRRIANNPLLSDTSDQDKRLNAILERELSGYRLINNELVPISNEQEVESIKEAISNSALSGLDGPSLHIKKALHLLGKKPDPDYANSIKESISAVESVCKLLSEETSGGLDAALNKLSAKIEIHAALKKGLLSLYGYTSNESGIRHAILENKDIGFAEAKFMLVACSGFVNFALDKAREAKII